LGKAGRFRCRVLSIGKLAAGQQDYYLRSVADGVEEYYLGSGEAPGRWLGRGAQRLQLSGQVTAESLTAVLAGKDPATGSSLWASSRARLPGWDLTFSAPKSVSLLYALGPEPVRRIAVQAHDHATSVAFGYLEREAGFVRRGHDGLRQEEGAGLVGAAFRHRTSRLGDPNLHTHVLMANLVATHDGDWRAVWSRAFYRHARSAGALYRAVLREELTRQLGVSWRPRPHGLYEIAGIPQPVLRAFSRRRTDIEAELAARGASGMAASRIATLATRPAKPGTEDPVQLQDRWAQQAEGLGFGREQLLDLLERSGGERELDHRGNANSEQGNLAQYLARHVARDLAQAGRPAGELDEVTRQRLQRELLGPAGLTAQTSTFHRRDIVRAVCDRLPAGASADAISSVTEQILHSADTVPLHQLAATGEISRFDERCVFTTGEHLRLERRILTVAEDGRKIGRAQVPIPALSQTLDRDAGLSVEQRQMVGRLCRSGNLLDVVTGVPGAGKTRGLDVARAAWQSAGTPVLGCSVKATAAAELHTGAGIASWTVARLLLDLDGANGTGGTSRLPEGAVLVVDEAGMLGTRHLARLLAHVHAARGKLVLVGDPKQLPSIEAAGLFPLLADQLDAITLTGNRRQTDPADRDALTAYRNDDIDCALESYAARGRLHTAKDAAGQRNAMVTRWWNDQLHGIPSVMLAYRRADIRQLNDLARTHLHAGGQLTGPPLQVTDEELGDRTFQTGDHVLLLRNHRPLGILNGDTGIVRTVDPRDGSITVTLGRRGQARLPHDYVAQNLAHGYAITIHASQGITIPRTHVLGNDALFYEAGLVALSRHKDTCHLYITEQLDLSDDRERSHVPQEGRDLASALRISRADQAAIDSRGRLGR
jgi:conjugative relaxase-like TrwC/TraI family protein